MSTQYITMGFEGAFYVGPRGGTSPDAVAMILAECIRNPKLTYSYSEVDATLRRHQGVKAYQKGLLDVTITFTLVNLKPRTADLALMLNSMLGRRQPITIIMLDEAGGEGIIGDFELFGGDKTEEDEDVQAWEITARPSAAGRKVQWYNGGA